MPNSLPPRSFPSHHGEPVEHCGRERLSYPGRRNAKVRGVRRPLRDLAASCARACALVRDSAMRFMADVLTLLRSYPEISISTTTVTVTATPAYEVPT